MQHTDNTAKDTLPIEEVIDLRQYFNVINIYKWKILLLAITVAIFAAVIAMNMTPIYRATSTLLIEADQAKAVSFEEIVGLDSNRKEYYLTQFEILKSRGIARSVIEKLNLKDHADFVVKESPLSSLKKSLPFLPKKNDLQLSESEREEQALHQLIKTFSERLTISPVRKTQMVNISYDSSDPKLAALVANAMGDTYIDQDLRAKLGLSQKASGWLTTRLSDLQVRLQKSEEKLQRYREKENLVDMKGVVGLVSKELEQTSEQLVVARNDMNKLQSIVRVIDEYGRDNIEMLESISEITSHSVIQNIKQTLTDAELKISELKNVYGARHPKMISARAELKTINKNLSSQIRQLVTGVEKELKASKRNVTALENELKRIRVQFQALTRKENQYRQLSREVETNRHIYDTFLSRSKETEVTSDFNAVVARFTDRAFKPNNPIKPKKALIVILAFVVALGLGIVAAFVLETLNDTLKSAGDVENKLAQRMLGLLPLVEIKKGKSLLPHYFFDKNSNKFSEAVRTIRTSFVLTQLEKDWKVVEVTSSVPGEGKTTVSINLAFSLGQMKNTILVDADLRKPSICKRFDIPAYHPGLANLIAGTDKFEDCIYTDEESGLTIMPCGQIPSNPLELLSSTRFTNVLAVLKKNYSHVIIDTAPVNAVSDGLVIAQQADALIYVVKSDDTRIGVVQNGITRLLDANVKISGVVLNQVDTKKMSKDDYYHGYYDSYSYGGNSESDSQKNT